MTHARRTPPKRPRPSPVPLAVSPALTALARSLQQAGGVEAAAGAALLRDFWAGSGAASPLVEPIPGRPAERLVTFLWQDATAERVLLFVNRLTDERNLAASYLRRVPGTDVWHLTYRMGADWRASYSFLPQRGVRPVWLDDDDQVAIRAALDRGLVDPRNPQASRNRAGTAMSVVSLPQAPPQRWLARRESIVRGRVTERVAPEGRRVWVYQPPEVRADLPVVIVLDGEVWTSSQDLATTMDNLIADDLVRPAYLVMVDSGGSELRWAELGERGSEPPERFAVSFAFDRYLVESLLPWARRECRIGHRPQDVVVAGASLGGLAALRVGLGHPDRIGGVLSQSASLWNDDLSGTLAGADPRGLRIYLEVGRQEWVLAEPNRRLAGQLTRLGAEVRFVDYNGGHDYACWRGGIADGLRYLLPR